MTNPLSSVVSIVNEVVPLELVLTTAGLVAISEKAVKSDEK